MGSLPYMALQLQSVGTSLLTLSPEISDTVAADELVLIVAALMALFAILCGSRRADRAGNNAGLVLTIAVEALVKIIALIAVAGLAVFVLLGEDTAATAAAALEKSEPVFSLAQIDARFVTLTLIAACAGLCLPRQFHMTFVEADSEHTSAQMRWVFPV